MAFENAKRLLQNKHARLSTTTEGIYDDNLIVLFWENIEAKHVTECINFLNESTQRVINAPSVFYDISFDIFFVIFKEPIKEQHFLCSESS